MTYTRHYKALLRLGFPIVVGQLGTIVLGFADTLMIGHHSTAELAASSFVVNVFTLCIIFCLGFSYGLVPVVGGFYGNGRYAEAGLALRCSLLANTLVALLLTLIMGVLYLNVERLGQPDELIPLIKPYYLTQLAALLFVMLFNAFKQFTDGITDTKTAMWILLGGNAFNILGNYLLIYGKCGFPEMGLLGAGIATLASRILMVAVYVFIFLRSKRFKPYRAPLPTVLLSPDKRGSQEGVGLGERLFRRLNSLGWPIALQMGMETASFNLVAIMVGWLGTLALAAHQIMLTASTFAFMILYGIGAAVAIRISSLSPLPPTPSKLPRLSGESNPVGRGSNDTLSNSKSPLPTVEGSGERLQGERLRVAYAGYHITLCVSLLIVTLFFLLRNNLGGWFTDNAEVSAMVAMLVIPFLFYQFGDGLQINFANALRGISDVKPMMLFAFIAYFIVSLPAAYLFGFVFHLGLPGIWLSFPFGLTTAGILYFLRFRRQVKKL